MTLRLLITGQYSVLFGIGDISDYSDVDLSESDYDEGEGAGHDDTEYWSSDGDKWTFSYGNSYSSQWGYLYYNGSYNWYYFSQEQGSGYGQLLTGTTTPDGYTVNENGEWVQ